MILKNIISEQNKIKTILRALCESKPTLCYKDSVSGFTSNERAIVIQNDFFEFYNINSKFKAGDLSTLRGQDLKGSVSLQDIYQLCFLPENEDIKKTIMISMPLNRIKAKNFSLYKDSAIKSSKKTEQENYITSWSFNFKFDVKGEIFKKLEEEQKKKKEAEHKFVKYDPESDLNESILNVSKQQKQVQKVDPVLELDKNIKKMKQIKQQLEFQQKLEKQEAERQRAIKMSMTSREKKKSNSKQSEIGVDEQEQRFPVKQAWRDYWLAYEKSSKLIDEQLSKEKLQRQIDVLNQLMKIERQVRTIVIQYINFKLVGWNPEKITFQDFEYYKGIWIKIGGKQLNQQFLSNYYLSDLVYLLKGYRKIKLRIPPMFFTQYKSIKAICMIDLPFNCIKALEKEVYNPKMNNKYDLVLVNQLKQAFEYFQKILNVKNQTTQDGVNIVTTPLGKDIMVFEYNNKFENKANYFIQNFYYVVGVKGLFPIDYVFQMNKFQPEYCLRPEIIAQYRDYQESKYKEDNQLLTQAFLHSDIELEIKSQEDSKVAEVSKQFIPVKIKRLMQLFNQISLIMIDSYSIKFYMSEMGINSRYLGQMYRNTEIPYIQQTLQIEMISKVIKKIYHDSVKDLINNDSFYKRELYMGKEKENLQPNVKHHNDLMAYNAIDFLNLVFGKGRQTTQFWKIVIKSCSQRFGVDVAYPLKIKAGCLLHAVLWHCGFIVNFSMEVKLFEVEKPFRIQQWQQFRLQVKYFQFPSFQINRIIRRISTIDFNQNDELYKFIFPFLKIELLRNSSLYGLSFHTQITLSKINNLKPELQRPLRQISNHPAELPYYFINKSPENFKKAVDIINFGLASNHPLFISLYDVYSQLFQPQLLKKSALLAAIKGLGQFHPRTTQLYSKYYREGFSEFEIKAKRSSQIEGALTITEQLYQKKKLESCLNFCYQKIERRQLEKAGVSGQDLRMYIQIIRLGLLSAVQTRFFKKGLVISEQYSQMISSFKIGQIRDHEIVLLQSLIIHLNLTSHKYFIYKLVLLAVHIQKQHEENLELDQEGFLEPRRGKERIKIIQGIINQYYFYDSHSKWIQFIFTTLKKGYLYFNYLNDLFNCYKHHIKNFNSLQFESAFGFLDILVRYFGQKIFHDNLYEVKT